MASTFPPFDGSAPRSTQFSAPPEMGIDPAKRYSATMTVSIGGEVIGDLVIALDAARAPKTVNNFVFLALNHYYDSIIFHRIIKNFVCQGGDPGGDGRGGPGYRFEDELPKPGQYEIGSLAMANAGPNTNGSQFFLCFIPCNWLDGKHCVFGQVTDGMEVLDALESVGSSSGATRAPCVIADCGQL